MTWKEQPDALMVAVVLATFLALAGCAGGGQGAATLPGEFDQAGSGDPQGEEGSGDSPVTAEFPHIHGLGFSADGRQLFVPAHDGLRLFSDGQWQIPDAPAHDYMGYAPADDGFYSSGHPHPSSGLVNPLGLVKSTDGGQTLTRLGFEGESDFHLMGVGYQNHAIYVVNPRANSRLAP
ncbi:MAG: F510_1955 family glycosylhydrolase, partial [Candidatus Promineifilaceae bacterium]